MARAHSDTAQSNVPDVGFSSLSLAARLAERMYAELISARLPPGSLFGSEEALRVRYRVGTGALREAIRLLELRECGRMRRGRGGGFVIELPTQHLVAQALAGYLCLRGATLQHLLRAHGALAAAAIEVAANARNPPDTTRHLAEGLLVHSRLLTHLCARSGSVVIRTLADVLEALFDFVPSSISLRELPSAELPCDALCEQRILSALQKGRREDAYQHLSLHERHITQALTGKAAPLALWYGMSERIKVHETRAGQVARNIIIEIVNGRLAAGVRLGATGDLCKRYSVSKAIGGQVVRLLEMMDVIRCERGRGRGVFVKEPSSERPVNVVCQHLHTRKIRASEADEVSRSIRRTSYFEADPRNPILALMLECLQAYSNDTAR